MRQRKRKAVVYRSGSAVCIQGKFYCFANIARLLFIIIIPFFFYYRCCCAFICLGYYVGIIVVVMCINVLI